jgi:hypothetical protein
MTKLPTEPAKRLEAFGLVAVGSTRWKRAVADAVGVTERVIYWWSEGNCPADLDSKLLRAANHMIAEQHERTLAVKSLREQLEGTA